MLPLEMAHQQVAASLREKDLRQSLCKTEERAKLLQ